jgi:hypothetical protein
MHPFPLCSCAAADGYPRLRSQPRSQLLHPLAPTAVIDRVRLRDHHRVSAPAFLQPLPKAMRAPVARVGDDPPRGDASPERPCQHPLGEHDLGREASRFRNSRLNTTIPIPCPLSWQVKGAVNEGRTVIRRVGEEDTRVPSGWYGH